MKRRDLKGRVLAVIMAVTMAMGNMPAVVFAEDMAETVELQQETTEAVPEEPVREQDAAAGQESKLQAADPDSVKREVQATAADNGGTADTGAETARGETGRTGAETAGGETGRTGTEADAEQPKDGQEPAPAVTDTDAAEKPDLPEESRGTADEERPDAAEGEDTAAEDTDGKEPAASSDDEETASEEAAREVQEPSEVTVESDLPDDTGKTAYPAFTVKNYAIKGTDITVSVDAPEGAFPEGIALSAALIETPADVVETIRDQVASYAEDYEEITGEKIVSFDIHFYLPEEPEKEIEPRLPIRVTFGNIDVDADKLEVYHTGDESAERNGARTEKVMGAVENTDALTVSGLDRFSEYDLVLLSVSEGNGAEETEEESFVKLYFNGSDAAEDGMGVYDFTSTWQIKPFSIEGAFPADATSKQLDITLSPGLTWNNYLEGNGSYSEIWNHLDTTQTWYKNVTSRILPTAAYSGPANQNFHVGYSTIPDGTGTLSTADGTLTFKFNDTLTWFITVGLQMGTMEVHGSIGATNLRAVDDPVLVTLSYKDASGELHVHQTKIARMNFSGQRTQVKTSGGNQTVTLVPGDDGLSRIEIPQDGISTTTEYRWLVETIPEAGYYGSWNVTGYYYAYLIPKSLNLHSFEGDSAVTVTDTAVIEGPISHTAGDGKAIEIGADQKLMIFTCLPHANERSHWTSGGGHYNAIRTRWDFTGIPADTDLDVTLIDVGIKMYGDDDWLIPPTTAPVARYRVVPQKEEVYANAKYSQKGVYSGNYINNAGTSANATIYLGADFEWDTDPYMQTNPSHTGAGNAASGVRFTIGNRGMGDSVPKQVDMRFDVNDIGGVGVFRQYLVYSNNDYDRTVTVKYKTWDGIHADSVSAMGEIQVKLASGGAYVDVSQLPGYVQGKTFLKELHYDIAPIPAQTDEQKYRLSGVMYCQALTDQVYGVNAGSINQMTVTDLEPDEEDPHPTATGTTKVGLAGKHRIEAINANGSVTVTAGQAATASVELKPHSAGGSQDWGSFIDEVYVISPYGSELTGWSVKTKNGVTVEPDIAELSTDGMNLPAAYAETARVYKLDFTKYSTRDEAYRYRLTGYTYFPGTDTTRNNRPITLTFRIQTSVEDPIGSVGSLVWVKPHYPHTTDAEGREIPDNAKVAWYNSPALDKSNYNLSQDTGNIYLRSGFTLTIRGTENLTVRTEGAAKGAGDAYAWTSNTDKTVISGNNGIDYRLTATNSTTSEISRAAFYFPVPKKGVTWPAKYMPDGAWTYDTSLERVAIDQGSNAAYTVYYTTAADGTDPADWAENRWMPWPEGGLSGDSLEAVTFVKVVAENFDKQKTDQITLSYVTHDYSEEDIGKKDSWAASFTSRLSTAETNVGVTKVSGQLIPAQLGGIVYQDVKVDGAYDPEDEDLPDIPVGGVSISLYRDIDGEKTKIDETETDEDGAYAFDGLVEGKTYTVEAANPDTETYFRFTRTGEDMQFTSSDNETAVAEAIPLAAGDEAAVDYSCGLLVEPKIEAEDIKLHVGDASAENGCKAAVTGGEGYQMTLVYSELPAADNGLENPVAEIDGDNGTVTAKNTGVQTYRVTAVSGALEDYSISADYTVTVYANVIYDANGATSGEAPMDVFAETVDGTDPENTDSENTNSENTDPENADPNEDPAGELTEDVTGRAASDEETDPVLREYYPEEKDSVTVLGNTGNLEWADHIFLGWSTDPEAETARYTEGDIFETGSVDQDITLYAVWLLETVTITGAKVWEDDHDADGNRPQNITLHLFADQVELEDKVLTVGADTDDTPDEWSFGWSGLDKRNADGEEILYEVREDAAPGYEAEVVLENVGESTLEKIVTVTNTQMKKDITVSKIWEDNDNAENLRPESITVRLLADGEETGQAVLNRTSVNADGNWTYTFENLPVRRGGQEITYTVTEDMVRSYTLTSIDGNAQDGFTITNTQMATIDGNVEPEESEPEKVTETAAETETEPLPTLDGDQETEKATEKVTEKTTEKETETETEKEKVTDTVKTGDETPLTLWIAILMAALLVIAGTGAVMRRKRRDAE